MYCYVLHALIVHHSKWDYNNNIIIIGDITIPGGVTLTMNTLTCISTGGPATNVTWTRDSVTIIEGTKIVLNNRLTAQYTHTLTVTSGGEYTCTVANNKPSTVSATISVHGINNFCFAYIILCCIDIFRHSPKNVYIECACVWVCISAELILSILYPQLLPLPLI